MGLEARLLFEQFDAIWAAKLEAGFIDRDDCSTLSRYATHAFEHIVHSHLYIKPIHEPIHNSYT